MGLASLARSRNEISNAVRITAAADGPRPRARRNPPSRNQHDQPLGTTDYAPPARPDP